ncbi:MAG: hypothetical protein H6978_08330 [Gammaproteobacteria bacterium]|nr:hypothetical protein [Gammaproteobacteria bacterium]
MTRTNSVLANDDSRTIVPFKRGIGKGIGTLEQSLQLETLKNFNSEHDLQALINSAVMEAYLAARANELGAHDGPFDPIYFSALKMDKVISEDIAKLVKYSGIEDLSAEIDFADGMDDY